MPEKINHIGDIEGEIAELTRQIEDKRRLLEEKQGVINNVDEKELLREAIVDSFILAGDKTSEISQSDEPKDQAEKTESMPIGHYFDYLPEDSIAKVNQLISQVPEVGITGTIKKARQETALVLDAFHDALVDKLYEEMKSRRLLK
jgi:hypothetical protein